MTKTALIAGGGIAGTVAALALHRAGWQTRLFESRPAGVADERGAFLTVAVNGLAALRALDLDPAKVLAAGFPTPSMAMTAAGGRRLAVLPLGGPAADGTVTTTIRRADLYGALREVAIEHGIPIEYDRRLTGYREEASRVTATFTGGGEVSGDLLVGADGLRSRTREILNPDGPAPTYLGLLNAGGFTSGEIDADLDRTPGLMHMAFGRKAFFGWVPAPDGSVWWFANPPSKTPSGPGDFTPSSWRAHLIDLFADDGFPAAAIIRATDVAIGPWNTDDLRRVPVWHSGRVVLAGDAAHAVAPSSGQGASMAIEDAVVLARCLSETDDVAAGLAGYERIRRPRVEKVVAAGRRNGSGKTAGPVGAAIRDAMLPLMMKMLFRNGANPQAWILDHRV
ncbi:2-polyprenyl-6-methoxyphenol hydroxylase-like FAD-dependent oxidoreductase [Actinoplanes tereljensis]|uniref:FAD-dependent oxidoreductase n=1 Tax=Paractinoplanes tereljensis TaxID=571912 RepID=A0A919NIH5_9ACTN|nr:NAD(P)/FAD-dependent oxidoreductase [Actinoplanes tereljensis]GIF18735.1 FAD-dependent oxidoreductase [Actinoplanes tereljensis]